jgi:hypothetical protein
MAKNKKQHYVPQFYLKFFSSKQEDTHIGLFHFKTGKLIRAAGLKNQAYEDYFYGKDDVLESGLARLEGDASSVLNEIINNEVLPKQASKEYWLLWTFVLVQAYRTLSTVKATNDMLNKTVKAIAKHDKNLKDNLDEFEVGFNDAAAFNLKQAIASIGVAKDLACKLIINKTTTPFITSDHPVILYNQFLEKRKFPGGRTGLATKGLEIFYPISPKLSLIFYDKVVYKVGFSRRTSVETTVFGDIDNFNFLQALNCDEQIYFSDLVPERYILELAKKKEAYQKKELKVKESLPKTNPDGTSSILMQVQKSYLEINLQLSFLKETDHAKTYVFTGYAAELRDEKLRVR